MTSDSGAETLRASDEGNAGTVWGLVRTIEECREANPRMARNARKELRKELAHRYHIASWEPLPADLLERVERAMQEHGDA
jgi:hypothetical protein